MTVETKATPDCLIDSPVLTNYDDKYIIMTAYTPSQHPMYEMHVNERPGDVQLYDIKRDVWSACPPRSFKLKDHKGICLDGKLFIFFGSVKF